MNYYYSGCITKFSGSKDTFAYREVPFDIRFAAGKDIQLERAKDEMVRLIGTEEK